MSKKTMLVFMLIGVALLSRFIPHPPNFSPLMAISLFAGAYLSQRWLALSLPLIVLFLSDLVLGFYPGMFFNYGALIAIAGMGIILSDGISKKRVAGFTLAGSVLFFVVSNLGVWLVGGLYPLTVNGLVNCFTMAIPFFANSLAGDSFYSIALFGLAHLLTERRKSVILS